MMFLFEIVGELMLVCMSLLLLAFGLLWYAGFGVVGLTIPLFAWAFRGNVSVAWEVYAQLANRPIEWISKTFYESKPKSTRFG